MSSKHIFIFLEVFSSEGGIQAYVQDLLKAYASLRGEDNCGEVFLLRDEKDSHGDFLQTDKLNFRYLKTSNPNRDRWQLTYLLGKTLLTHKPQHVYCGHINLAPLVASYCLLWGIPYTVLTYGKEVWGVLPWLKRQALQKATGIWTISRYSRDRLCEANGIAKEKVKILPCVVDSHRFTPGNKPEELVKKYNLGDDLVLMTVARLWSGDIYKGVDVTIRALPQIIAVFPQVKYLVIGRGDDQQRLAKLAADLGVSQRVIFAGFIPNSQLPDHYRLAEVYVMPSQEGFGIVYLEALASGIPVIAGDADGSADPLQDGLLGWQVSHRDPDAVAKACVAVLQGGDHRVDAAWLREATLDKFSQSSLTAKLNDLLNS